MKNFRIIIVLFFAILNVACAQNSKSQNVSTENRDHSHRDGKANGVAYQKGDVVPHNEVCMVNDAYMGKKQIEVEYEGKKYYGCCEMCEKRIPKEKEVRMAVDPVSKKQVDKAKAVIAITGDNSEVSYFENNKNYKTFFKQK
jgi:YHS domain-containing protein